MTGQNVPLGPDLTDLGERTAESVPAGTPARLRLLANADAGYHENNLGRSAIWWLAPDLQMPIWEALELTGFTARVSGIPSELGPLSLYDSLVFVCLETMWAEQAADARAANFVPYSLTELWHRLGHRHDPSGLDAERLRRSLLRLTYARIERGWWDAGRGETVHQVRGLVADADFIRKGRPGQWGRAMRGFVRFSPELLDQLNRRHVAYALDLPTLLDLPTPLSQRLYLLLSVDQMKPVGASRNLVAFTYPLGRALYDTLGVTDTNPRRVRAKLAASGLAIIEREPLYLKIAIEARARRRHEWQLAVVRRRGRSLAPQRRRHIAQETARTGRRELIEQAIGPVPLADVPLSTPSAEQSAAEREHERRWKIALADPRAVAKFNDFLREQARSPAHTIAWREHRRDYLAWLAEGEVGPEPAEPEVAPVEIEIR